MTRLNANQFPAVYQALDLEVGNLGCIMLDLDAMDVVKHVPDGADDIYEHPDPVLHPYTRGVPAEHVAHVTLLYGLLKPGPTWSPLVNAVLGQWTPDDIEIEEVSFFPSSIEGEDYSVIIGKVRLTDNLLEGHNRLSFLPHIDTFPGYHPHVTLAYVKGGYEIREKWVEALDDHFAGLKLPVKAVNLGDSGE